MKNSFYEAGLCTPPDFIGLDRYCDYTTGTEISILHIGAYNGGKEVDYLTYPDIYCVDGMTFIHGVELNCFLCVAAGLTAPGTQGTPQRWFKFINLLSAVLLTIQLSNNLTI